ncbi:hypothetical protein BpHYR1_000216 [Brachionus plicatilis]|uniref:Uncharacterized protein n=1 Tax=Brachionus plicatilis TaxID=10195 RepID=A0A3M7SDM4_BRAPC|nr:hypothetical protein BpHYR1_000216 [Brachionus plicatilis]
MPTLIIGNNDFITTSFFNTKNLRIRKFCQKIFKRYLVSWWKNFVYSDYFNVKFEQRHTSCRCFFGMY